MNKTHFERSSVTPKYIVAGIAVVLLGGFWWYRGDLTLTVVIWALIVILASAIFKTWNICSITMMPDGIRVSYYSPFRSERVIQDAMVSEYKELKMSAGSRVFGGIIQASDGSPVHIFSSDITRFNELNELLLARYNADKNLVEQVAASDS